MNEEVSNNQTNNSKSNNVQVVNVETNNIESQFVVPEVNHSSEFLEIASDFGNPLEVVREAISNAYDWGASYIKIKFEYKNDKLIIEFEDDGVGMSEKGVKSFWDLGNSRSKGNKLRIGEKGHGTKIYLKSDRIEVTTFNTSNGYKSICENPKNSLLSGTVHKYTITNIKNSKKITGTKIKIEGYDNNETSNYVQDIVKDYIYWFTKVGSFESKLEKSLSTNESENEEAPQGLIDEDEINAANDSDGVINKASEFVVWLKCLDYKPKLPNEYEKLDFGHIFATINDCIETLKKKYEKDASKYFVKKYCYSGNLDRRPDISYDFVIYVEGDKAKRDYNKMIREKVSSASEKKGKYKVVDRYGIWLSKDFIPIERVNDWVQGFGNGSNSIVYLHGFLNCQHFRLTANRGSITIDASIEDELRSIVKEKIAKIDDDLRKNGIWRMEEDEKEEWSKKKTEQIEKNDYEERVKVINDKKQIKITNRDILENKDDIETKIPLDKLLIFSPKNESELFGVFLTVYSIYYDKFEFEVLDYNTHRGVDIIVRQKAEVPVSESEFKYLELKNILKKEKFNHTFKNLKWIICWDFSPEIKDGSELKSSIDEIRIMKFKGNNKYYLEADGATPIRVIRLREFLINELEIRFED